MVGERGRHCAMAAVHSTSDTVPRPFKSIIFLVILESIPQTGKNPPIFQMWKLRLREVV